MKFLNSLTIVILLLSGCTTVQDTRSVPGLALATVIEKGINESQFILKLESTDKQFVATRTSGNPFVYKILLHTYVSEAVYNEVSESDRVVLVYQTFNEGSKVMQKVQIVRKKEKL